MRIKVVILFLSFFNLSFGQLDKIKGNWISANNEMLSIKDTLASDNYLMNANLRTDNFYLSLNGKTISFQSRYFYSSDMEKMHTNRYDLKILDLNDSILLVQPTTKNSISFFKKSGAIKFLKQNHIKDNNLKFEKIIFHSSTCFGTCPVINLEINSSGKIKINTVFLKNEFIRDELSSGNFYGKLTIETFEELKKIIIQSKLTSINITGQELCCDGAEKTIIFYHNGKRNYIKTMFEPRILRELIDYLYEIDIKVKLIQTNEKLKFEN